MKPFKKLSEPKELDFYSIFTDNRGVKMIHINGYTYKSDDYWANIECSGILMKVENFVRTLSTNKDFINELYEAANQYQGDFDEKQILNTINHYFNGKPADNYLKFTEITTQTPDGNYVC